MLHLCAWAFALIAAADGAGEAAKRPAVSRADLASALQRFERAFLDHRPEGQALVDANMAFEDVTQSFFRMDFGGAIAKLNESALELSLGRPPTANERWLASLKVQVEPPVVVAGAGDPTVRLRPMYATPDAKPSGVALLAVQGERIHRFSVGTEGESSPGAPAATALTLGGMGPGTWELVLELPEGMRLATGRRAMYVPRDLDELREANAERLARAIVSDETRSALATCRARNELLKMSPNEGRSVEFLADYNVLASEVAREIDAIEAGRNPYAKRKGDYWRILEAGSTRIPLRMYCPETLSLDDAAPLVIALHGAGGDENMFFDAYGQGAIKREADRRGFLVASPATFYFAANGKNLKPLLADLSRDYPVDADRVYVLGHSMGGAAAAVQARENADVLAAACCIAGGRGFGGAKGTAPTLVVAAELDAIVPAAAVEGGARAAIASGLPVEFRLSPNYGHTLVVESELGRCIDWLLDRRRR
jgi:predicted esterase